MATATQLKKVVSAITGMGNAVTETFVESALTIAAAGNAAWGGSLDIPEADVTTVVNGVGDANTWGAYKNAPKGSKKAKTYTTRVKEVKDILGCYPTLGTGAKAFKHEFGKMRREHFVKLTRMIPEYVTATDAAMDCAAYFTKRDADRLKGSNATKPEDKLANGFTAAINAARELKNDALANSLRTLARKHGVTLK